MIVFPYPAAPDAEIWGRRTVVDDIVIVDGAGGATRHVIVRDAVASIHPDLAEAALTMMERNMGAQLVDAADVRFGG